MENPYFALHREFREAGADVLISSGQACVVFGIAAFSRDGDWVIRGEYLIVEKLSPHFAEYRRGEVVAMRDAQRSSNLFLKRIVALPGETVAIEDGTLRIETPVNRAIRIQCALDNPF